MNGARKLGSLLMGEMKATGNYTAGEPALRFGTIETDLALKPDALQYSIPDGEYLLCSPCADSIAEGNRVVIAQIGSNFVVIGVLAGEETEEGTEEESE